MTKRKPGRPSTFTPKIGEAICEGLIAGKPMRSILAKPGMPKARTVLDWLESDSEFARMYARARAMAAHGWACEIVHLADQAKGKSGDEIQARRLMVDTRKWVISKLLPKVYGERLQHDFSEGATLRLEFGRRDVLVHPASGVNASVLPLQGRAERLVSPEDSGDLVESTKLGMKAGAVSR